MMKAASATLLGVFLASGAAHADYHCLNKDMSLDVKENHMTRLSNASVTLINGEQTKTFYGSIEAVDDFLLQKKVIDFYPYQGEEMLTLVTRPKFCGRGSCDDGGGTVTNADLKLGEEHIYFSCEWKP